MNIIKRIVSWILLLSVVFLCSYLLWFLFKYESYHEYKREKERSTFVGPPVHPLSHRFPKRATDITDLGNGWSSFCLEGNGYLHTQWSNFHNSGEAITVMPDKKHGRECP